MSLPVGTVPTVRDIVSYGMSLCSYTCPYRKGQTFGPKSKSSPWAVVRGKQPEIRQNNDVRSQAARCDQHEKRGAAAETVAACRHAAEQALAEAQRLQQAARPALLRSWANLQAPSQTRMSHSAC